MLIAPDGKKDNTSGVMKSGFFNNYISFAAFSVFCVAFSMSAPMASAKQLNVETANYNAATEIAAALYAASATQEAILRNADAIIQRQRMEIDDLRVQVSAGQATTELLSEREQSFVEELARRDRMYAQEIAVFRENIEGIANSPERLVALARFNRGDRIGAIEILSELDDANAKALAARRDIEEAITRRQTAALALEALRYGEIPRGRVIEMYERITKLDPTNADDFLVLMQLYHEIGDYDASIFNARKAMELLLASYEVAEPEVETSNRQMSKATERRYMINVKAADALEYVAVNSYYMLRPEEALETLVRAERSNIIGNNTEVTFGVWSFAEDRQRYAKRCDIRALQAEILSIEYGRYGDAESKLVDCLDEIAKLERSMRSECERDAALNSESHDARRRIGLVCLDQYNDTGTDAGFTKIGQTMSLRYGIKLIDVYVLAGRPDLGEQFLLDLEAMMRSLEGELESREYDTLMATALNTIGDFRRSVEDGTAKEAFETASGIFDRLLEADPDSVQLNRGKTRSLYGLARSHEDIGEQETAKNLYVQGLVHLAKTNDRLTHRPKFYVDTLERAIESLRAMERFGDTSVIRAVASGSLLGMVQDIRDGTDYTLVEKYAADLHSLLYNLSEDDAAHQAASAALSYSRLANAGLLDDVGLELRSAWLELAWVHSKQILLEVEASGGASMGTVDKLEVFQRTVTILQEADPGNASWSDMREEVAAIILNIRGGLE